MNWSITIGRIGGTAIRLHITFILFLMWIGISGFRAEGYRSALSTVIFILLVFACVLAHEFGHILMAKHYGIKTPDVTLWPIGGIASMERIPEDPWQELPVALAGPMVNVAIAALLMFFGGLALGDFPNAVVTSASLLPQLALVNLSLVVFNLVPAFPMDGGRVLRALLAMMLGPQRATEIAARLGQGFAFLFVLLGLFYNPMLSLIGLFIFIAASAELRVSQIHRVLNGLTVSDCMERDVQKLAPDQTLSEAVEILLCSSQRSYPVVNEQGKPVGTLQRGDLSEILRKSDASTKLSKVMGPAHVLASNTKLEDALNNLNQMRDAPEIVTDPQGHVIGMLTLQSIAQILTMCTLPPKGPLHGA